MSELDISEAQKVIMWSVIQLMTHFTGNNFWCNYNIWAVPGALQLAPIMAGSSL